LRGAPPPHPRLEEPKPVPPGPLRQWKWGVYESKAADAYARINGIGAVCVTYCVGGLNTVNAIACAYAERSPVVLLTGSPGLSERVRTPYLHHMVRDFSTQRDVFEKITVAAISLADPSIAEREMDRAFAALLRYRRPIYIEIPRDLVHTPLANPLRPLCLDDEPSDTAALDEAIAEVRAMLASASRPAILAGAEIGRFGLQDDLIRLVEQLNVPIASTLLAVGVVGIFGSLLYARTMSEGSIYQNAALTAVQGYIEQMKNMELSDLPYTSGSTVVAGSGATSTQVPTLLISTAGSTTVASSDPLIISTATTIPDLSTIGIDASTSLAGVTDNVKLIDVNSTPDNTTDDLRLNLRVWIQDISNSGVSATQVRAITIQYAWRNSAGQTGRVLRGSMRTIRSAVPTY